MIALIVFGAACCCAALCKMCCGPEQDVDEATGEKLPPTEEQIKSHEQAVKCCQCCAGCWTCLSLTVSAGTAICVIFAGMIMGAQELGPLIQGKGNESLLPSIITFIYLMTGVVAFLFNLD